MKLQNIIFPSAKNCTEELLYFRRRGDARYRISDDHITLNKEAAVSFDTYFNGFSAGKWFKYTRIENISLKLWIKGCMRVRLIYKEKQPDQIFSYVVGERCCDTKGKTAELEFPFQYERKTGMYAFELEASEDGCCFYEGAFYAAGEEAKKAEDIKIALIICTYKREEFIYKNLGILNECFWADPNSEMNGNLEAYISDNACTLDPSRAGEGRNIHIFPNKNTGGSGGFTRGMIECLRARESGITHVLLMDDDIVIQPESVFRTYSILKMLKPEFKDAYIGGAMLRTDKQWYQTESGSLWNSGNLIGRKAGLDLRELDACLYNEFEEKCDYNAWWYCTIPMEYVKEDNLPLPIFIRGDDVEYGLRNMKALILMNGICVWHEPFEFKYSSSMYYYIFRNRLIDNAIHGVPYSKKQFLKEFREWFKRELFTYRFKNAQLLLDGANDFLKGIEWFKQQDGETLNQEIMKKGYHLKNISELEVPFDFPIYDQTIHRFEGRLHQLKRILLLNGLFLKASGDAIVPTIDPHILYFYRKERALHYDYMSQKGFVTRKDNKEFFRLYREYRKLKRLCGRKYDSISREYGERGKELMDLGFWKKYLNLEEKGENK